MIEEVKHRYGLIGRSPLTRLTLRKGELLAGRTEVAGLRRHAQLEAVYCGHDCGHEGDGVERAVVICLAPQNSRTSVGLYRAALNVEGVCLLPWNSSSRGMIIRS